MGKRAATEKMRAVRAYLSGMTIYEVGKEYGVTGQAVRKWILEAGHTLRKAGIAAPSARDIQAMRALYEQHGYTAKEVGSMFGLSRENASKWLRRCGAKMRGPGHPVYRQRGNERA